MLKIAFAGGSLVAVLALALLIDAQSAGPSRPPRSQGVQHRISAPGRVEGSTEEIELRPELTGKVVDILVREGQWVSAGEALLRLDDATYRQEVALAAAQVELEEARLERLVNGARSQERQEQAAMLRAKLAEVEGAQKRVRRIKRANESASGAVSAEEAEDRDQELDSLANQAEAARARLELLEAPAREDEVRMARARVRAAQERLELARAEHDKTILKAPTQSQVLRVHAELGELWGPQATEPAVILADTSKLFVRAFVEELDAPQVKLGMPATVTADGLRGQSFTGRVTRLSPRMGAKQLWTDQPGERIDTKVREVWVELDRSEGLVVGLRVDVMIEPRSDASVAGSGRLASGRAGTASGAGSIQGAGDTARSPRVAR